MKKLLMAVAAVAAFGAFGGTIYVDCNAAAGGDGSLEKPFKTFDDGLAAANAAGGGVISVAPGKYTTKETYTISKAITVTSATKDPKDVAIRSLRKTNTSYNRLFQVNHADAVLEYLTLSGEQYGNSGTGGTVQFGAKGGTLRHCIVESGSIGSGGKGGGVYIDGGATVTDCVIRNCNLAVNGTTTGVGVYIANGTLDHCLVYGSYHSAYLYSKDSKSAVYLEKGLIDHCTIADNVLSHAALQVKSDENCTVRDTIVWGNTAWRDTSAHAPNYNIGAKAAVENLFVSSNPSFVDSANGDYRLGPGSPCIGAGTGGSDLGYKAYDGTADALGIRISAFKGVGELEVTHTLSASGAYAGAIKSVAWEGLPETGTVVTHTYGPGNYDVKATVTLTDDTTVTATLPKAVRVTYGGEMHVNSASTAPAAPYATPETAAKTIDDALAIASDGAVIHVAAGDDYTLQSTWHLLENIKVIGAGERSLTHVAKKSGTDRFFYLGNANALVANLDLDTASSSGMGGGVWIGGNGGTVSNCVIRGCSTGASQKGGGVYMTSAKALVTHSLISGNKTGNGAGGAGVCLDTGALVECLVISNKVGNNNANSLGGGVYLPSSTPDAKVVNCTIAHNHGYSGGGIYRAASAGFIYNTIVFDNTAYTGEDPNFTAVDNKTRPTATSISNCCATVEIGGNCHKVSSAPYVMPSYELNASTASGTCIDLGNDDVCTDTTDYAGNGRVFNGIVDIGCFEYCKSSVEVGFTASDVLYAGVREVELTATIVPTTIDISTCACTWYFDGAEEPSATGAVVTNAFGVGAHAVRLTVEYDGKVYTKTSEGGFIRVLPTDVYADASAGDGEAPYDTPAKACSNLNRVVNTVIAEGMTVHVAEGAYPISKTLSVGANTKVIGAGMWKTVVYDPTQKFLVMSVSGANAYVEGLCLSNGQSNASGGLRISGDGGFVTKCRITKCSGGTNQNGGGCNVSGAHSVLDSSIIDNNDRTQPNGVGSGGGLVLTDSAVLQNCLVVSNTAHSGGGVYQSKYAEIRNCTIVGNRVVGSGSSVAGGGVLTDAVPNILTYVYNSIIRDNVNETEADPAALTHDFAGLAQTLSHCCLRATCGTASVTDDPQFKDAANGDYRIGGASPCAYSGVYQSDWMPGATDFFGNPRTTPGKKVSIGYCQAPDPGLMLLVR